MTCRIGHVADIHLTQGPRGDHTFEVLQWIAEDGAAQGVEAWMVAGDLLGIDVPHTGTPWELDRMDRWIQMLLRTAPVVVIQGNHCSAFDVRGFGRLRSADGTTWPSHAYCEPGTLCVDLPGGKKLNVVALPFPSRPVLAGLGVESSTNVREEFDAAGDAYRRLLVEWAEVLPRSEVPTVLCAHINVIGGATAGDEIMQGKEPELLPEDLDAFPADYVALGHLHAHQQVAARAWYPGPPVQQHHGEEAIRCSYIIADVANGAEPVIHRRYTPTEPLVSVRPKWDPATGWDLKDLPGDLSGLVVRAPVTLSRESRAVADLEALEAELRRRGAASVTLDPRTVPTTRVRCEAMRGAATLAQQLETYWNTLSPAPGRAQRDRLLGKLAILQEEQAEARSRAEHAQLSLEMTE